MGCARYGLALAAIAFAISCAAAPPNGSAPSSRPPIAAASATAGPPAPPTPPASTSSTPPAAQPAPVPGPERLSRALAPKGQADGVLLLGLHLESIEGYLPMFSSEGKPRTDTRPGYRTLVLRTHDGTVEVVGELPFIAVPRPSGFLFLGEASVSIHLGTDPRVTLYDGSLKQRDYDATAIWRTTDASRAAGEERATETALRAKKAWGVENTEQIVYVTQRALCTSRTESEVTGGALYFHASSYLSLSSLGGEAMPASVFAHVDEPAFRRFVTKLLDISDEDVELDRPFNYNMFDLIIWPESVVACIDRERGAVKLTGGVRVSSNSARSFTRAGFVGPASAALAPDHEVPDYDAIAAAVDGATDAFVAPAHDVVLVERAREKQPRELVAWDVIAGRERRAITLPGRPIMDEWATGEMAARWLKALRPHLHKPTALVPKPLRDD